MKDRSMFENRVKKMLNKELVSTYQFVSGLFARYEEKLDPKTSVIAEDLNVLKQAILNRLEKTKPINK